jgi:hypothetical protein
MTLVSSANNIDFDIGFIMNNRVPRIDPWGNPCFSLPHLEKKLSCIK